MGKKADYQKGFFLHFVSSYFSG